MFRHKMIVEDGTGRKMTSLRLTFRGRSTPVEQSHFLGVAFEGPCVRGQWMERDQARVRHLWRKCNEIDQHGSSHRRTRIIDSHERYSRP